MTTSDPLLYTLEQAAAQLSIGITSVKGLVQRGELHSIRIGRSRRIIGTSLDEYIQRLNVVQNGEHA